MKKNNSKIKRTQREKMIIDIFTEELDKKDKKITELELLLLINKKYLRYTNLEKLNLPI